MHLTLGDADIHYDLHGEGEPLLWLHGGLGHGPDWTHIFSEAPAGYRLIAPDLRGHGRSTGGGPTYSFKQSALDMFALLDALGIDRVKIVGLSGGGITALHMAILQPARVSSMVVVSAPAVFPEQAKAVQRTFSLAKLGDQLPEMRRRHSREGQLESLISQMRALADGNDPNFTAGELQSITADTLIVFGDRDFLYPVSMSVDLKSAMPNSWLWVVPNGGHGPVFGPLAPDFVKTSLAFLGGAYR